MSDCYYINGKVHCMEVVTAAELRQQGWAQDGVFRMACDDGECHMHEDDGRFFNVWLRKKKNGECEVAIIASAPPPKKS